MVLGGCDRATVLQEVVVTLTAGLGGPRVLTEVANELEAGLRDVDQDSGEQLSRVEALNLAGVDEAIMDTPLDAVRGLLGLRIELEPLETDWRPDKVASEPFQTLAVVG